MYSLLAHTATHRCTQLLFTSRNSAIERDVFVTASIIAVCTVIAMFLPNIAVVFEFIGASSSTLLVFVFPAAFFARLRRGSPGRATAAPWMMALVGAVLLVGGTIVSILAVLPQLELQPDLPATCAACDESRGLNATSCIP